MHEGRGEPNDDDGEPCDSVEGLIRELDGVVYMDSALLAALLRHDEAEPDECRGC
jgi:hypothetical protein